MSLATGEQTSQAKAKVRQDSLLERGLDHHVAGRLDEAEAFYRLVLADEKEHADALHLLGMTAFQRGDSETAISKIRRAITINPRAASYHSNLGNVLQKQGFAREAAACYLQAIAIKPNVAEAHANLAGVFLEAGQLEHAVIWYERALAIDPSLSGAHRHLGDALRLQSRLEDAAEAYERAVAIKPDDADAYDWAGRVLREMGDLEGALRKFQGAQTVDPTHPRACFGVAMVQLLQGDFDAGWQSYERRWSSTDHGTPMRAYTQPRWNGEQLQSGRILLWPEQGIGDEIMFAGLLPDVIRNGNSCVLACEPRLQPLLARSFPAIEVVADTPPAEGEIPSTPQDIQAQLPAGSLPGLFRNSLAAFQTVAQPYLTPDAEKRTVLRDRYTNGRRLVGLAWYSNNIRTGATRSISLTTLAPLIRGLDVQWVSLQYGEPDELVAEAKAAHISLLVDDSVDQLTDMDEFAAQVAAMDLVITVDNTTAHLAGALGVPVWLLLPFGPDWRWLATGTTSPWYPSLRLFRQTVRGSWNSVLEEVRVALQLTLHDR